MDKIIRNNSEENNSSPENMSTVMQITRQLGSSVNSLFASKPSVRRRPTNSLLGIEGLEDRVLMSATPWTASEIGSPVAGGESNNQQEAPSVIVDRQEPIGLSAKIPHFFTDYISATPDDPVTVEATVTFEDEYSSPSLLIAQTERANHRNGLRESLYVQINRNGNGYITQFLGSDDNRSTHFTYDALPIGASVDLKMTYDGSEVSISVFQEGTQIANHSFTPPNPYSSAKFGASNMKWDSGTVSATLQSFTATQGKEIEQPVVEPIADPAAMDSVFSDPALIDSLFSSSVEENNLEDAPEQSFPDTAEGRLQALKAKREALQLQINDLVLEKTDLETLLARQQALLVEADRLGIATDDIMQRFANQENMERMRVTPKIQIQAQRFQRHINITYTDMQAGLSLVFMRKTFSIPEGSGSLRLDRLPGWGNNTYFDMNLLDTQEDTTQRLTRIKMYRGKVSRVGSMNQTTNLTQQSYIPEVPGEMRVSAEEKTEADQMKIYSEKNRIAAQTEIARLSTEHDAVEEEISSLEREKISYARMHVATGFSGDQPTFLVHFASNKPQTYVELIMEGGGDFRTTIDHADGQEDGLIEINMRRLLEHNNSGGGNVKIAMYADSSKEELLDIFTGGNYSSRNNRTSGETNGDWDHMETGRIVENPYTPTMTFSQIVGPNVIVSLQSPYDSSTVTLDGGGLFNQQVVSHEDGTELQSVRLTFNADNPEGDYSVRVREGRNGMNVSGLGLHWNPATKELTMIGENPTIVVTADTDAANRLQAMKQQMSVQSSIDDIGINIGSLRNVQDTHLYEASTFYIDTDDAKSYIDNSALYGHPDASGIFHQTLSGYEAAMKEALRAAAKVAVAAWSGESQQEAIEVFEREHGRVGLYRYLREFTAEFGVQFPSSDAVLKEGIRLANAQGQAERFEGYQEKEGSMNARNTFLANGGGPVGNDVFFVGGEFEGGGVAIGNPDGTLVGSEQSVEEHIQQTIADRVAARLSERLASMSIEERAEARGLLRLHQEGMLNNYFKSIFANGISDEAIKKVESDSGIDSENLTFSFLVSRPLQINDAYSHNFIVVGARYRGDPLATIYSFGNNDEGNVGRVDNETINQFSNETYEADKAAWLNLKGEFNIDNTVQLQLIPAVSKKVELLALSMIENQDYSMIAGIFGANSNSAAQAIANAAANMEIPIPNTGRTSPGSGSYDEIEFNSN